MNVWRKLFLAVGTSILIGILMGFLTSELKYYFHSMDSQTGKLEITEQIYDEASRQNSKKLSEENVFNTQMAILSSLTSFSVLIIAIGLGSKNTMKTE